MNAETVEVTVAITEGTAGKDGINGKDGEKGEKGEKGDAFTFADFTPEQLASLKGEKGDKGEKGEKGDPGTGGGASIDWIQNTDRGVISIGKNQTLVHNSNSSLITFNSIVIGNDTRCADAGVFPVTPERCVVIGHGTVVEDFYCCTLGNNISTYGQDAVAIGDNAQANYQGISIGTRSWTSNNAVAIGYQANSDSYGIAIGENAQAEYGNITLKSGNVEVKFSAEGMTLNGEPYGQGGSSGGSGGGTDYAQQMLYKVKYAHTDLETVRNSQSSEWREIYDEYGNSQGYNHYPYYDDITAKGEWYYDLKTNSTDNDLTFYTQFNENPLLVKFAAKIGGIGIQTTCTRFFNYCNNLEEVIIDCPFLQNCNTLFDYCPKVHTFYADLSRLSSASCMFGSDTYSCTSLNVESVEHIANSISSYGGEIHIGMARELQWDNGDGKYQRCQDALSRIRNKGWTVYEIYSENY